jgi:hypothetical protein
MTMVNTWTIVHVLVVTDETICGGWISPTTVKMSPATIAERPAPRRRFEAVIFHFALLELGVCRTLTTLSVLSCSPELDHAAAVRPTRSALIFQSLAVTSVS